MAARVRRPIKRIDERDAQTCVCQLLTRVMQMPSLKRTRRNGKGESVAAKNRHKYGVIYTIFDVFITTRLSICAGFITAVRAKSDTSMRCASRETLRRAEDNRRRGRCAKRAMSTNTRACRKDAQKRQGDWEWTIGEITLRGSLLSKQ